MSQKEVAMYLANRYNRAFQEKKALNFENEQCRFEKSERHCAIPGTKMKLLSATLLQRLMRCVGFKL
jgi:hypothetical protein